MLANLIDSSVTEVATSANALRDSATLFSFLTLTL